MFFSKQTKKKTTPFILVLIFINKTTIFHINWVTYETNRKLENTPISGNFRTRVWSCHAVFRASHFACAGFCWVLQIKFCFSYSCWESWESGVCTFPLKMYCIFWNYSPRLLSRSCLWKEEVDNKWNNSWFPIKYETFFCRV